ncbi:MAG: DMT family transporter [Spirochaetales bacterium]|nr:DMT family transporter [Spirochaetales bacterium]
MNESSKHRGGTGAALFSIIIWSSTYISTTILVQSFTPLQISFVRFSIGLGVMLVLAPPRKAPLRLSGEIPFMGAGFLGMFLYYFLENMAARHTYAANVSVIVTSIPLLTSLMAPLFFKEETLRPRSLVSFLLTMGGFLLILSQSEAKGGLSPLGDLLALAAAVVFALYTLLLRTIDPQLSTLLVTRKTLQYGWIAITAATLLSRSLPNPAQILQGYNPAHFLFLGIAASGLSFITWTHAVSTLGPVRSSQFIYLVPLITVTLSTLILKEQFTPLHMAGLLLILGAVIFSQLNFPLPAKSNPN